MLVFGSNLCELFLLFLTEQLMYLKSQKVKYFCDPKINLNNFSTWLKSYFKFSSCKILDGHLKKLAEQHLETKFIKLDVEKAPFLTQRFKIKVIPSMGIIKDGETRVRLVIFL